MSAMSVKTAEALRRAKRWRKPSSTVVPFRFPCCFGGSPRAEFGLFARNRGAPTHEVEPLPRGPYVVHADDRRALASGVQRRSDRCAGARRRGCAGIDGGEKRLAARADGDRHACEGYDFAEPRQKLETLPRVLGEAEPGVHDEGAALHAERTRTPRRSFPLGANVL